MRTNYLVAALLVCCYAFTFGQNKITSIDEIDTVEELKSFTTQIYLQDIQESQKLFNDKMLNVLFADEVGAYVNDSKDLSLQKTYFTISTADKTLFIGHTFDFRDKKIKKLSHILTIGVKAALKDDFSTIFKNGEANDDIGFNFKYTYIGRGIIDYGKYGDVIERLRGDIIEEKFNDEINKYLKEGGDFESEKILNNTLLGGDSQQLDNKLKQVITAKAEQVYGKMAETEVEYLRKNKFYNYLWDHWVTFETYIPVTEKNYNVISDINTITYKAQKFYGWKALLGYTSFWKTSKGNVWYLSGFGTVFNNNNIETEVLSGFTLPEMDATNPNLIKRNTDVFVGNFDAFVTTSLKAEMVSLLFFDGTFGLSASIEKNFGEYDATNWKLGMPFSLKDKEDKPTVNFELQWKEVNKNHFVGIGVGFAFGKFIK